MMGSIAMGNANPAHVKTAIYDVVTRHLQGELDTPGAVAALRTALKKQSASVPVPSAVAPGESRR